MLLGFEGLVRNSVDGVSSRDFVAELLFSAQIVMIDLSRIAEEVVLWSSSEFGYTEVADEYAATSSSHVTSWPTVVRTWFRRLATTCASASCSSCTIRSSR